MLNEEKGILFEDDFQKSLKEKFFYATPTPYTVSDCFLTLQAARFV